MFTMLANALVPIFAGLLMGYAAGRRRIVDNLNVRSLTTFLMSFALPCSLFANIARTQRLQILGQGRVALALTLVYLVIFAVIYLPSRLLHKTPAHDSAVLALTLGLPNVTVVGIPLLIAAYGPQTGVTTAVSIAVGAITVSPLTLAILESGTEEGRALSHFERMRIAVWRACKKPVVWAPLFAILAVFAGLSLPSYLDRSLTLLGAATAGTALFLTGLVVSAERFSLN